MAAEKGTITARGLMAKLTQQKADPEPVKNDPAMMKIVTRKDLMLNGVNFPAGEYTIKAEDLHIWYNTL